MNHVTVQHPPRERLLDFGLGKLDEGDAQNVEAHISECDTCCETLLNMQDDTFVNLVRRSDGGDTHSDQQASETPSVCESEPTQIEATIGWGGDAVGGEFALPRELAEHPRYRIVKLIGRGGMGDVFKAHHKVMDRPVALKVIKSELVRKPDAVRRFQREVQAAARLHHPNIVTAHDAEQAGDLHFLVMEFVDGVNLDEVVKRRGRLSVPEACDCIRQAAEGVEHAHRLGMVHRDIKPHNLMLAETGEVKILDFGLANFASEMAAEESNGSTIAEGADGDGRTHHLTQAGTMMGTPDYIAPEQAADAHTADVRSDIYSLGCTFYALLTGRAPFGERSLVEKIKAHSERDVPPLADFRDDVPAEVEAVLRKMTAKDPADRYQSPAEVVAALQALRTETPVTSFEPAKVERSRSRMDRFAIATAVLTVGCLLLTFAGASLPVVAVTWFIGVGIGWGLSSWMTLKQARRGLSVFGGLAWAAMIVLAGIVLFIQTDKGTVRIEINDPRIKVTLAGETLTFKNDGEEITVKPGEHSLHIQRGGLKFETKKFTLGRGKNPSLVVERTQRRIVVRQGERKLGNWPLPEPKPTMEPEPGPAPLVAGRRYEGHTQHVSSLAVPDDGSVLVSGSADGTVRVWDVKTRRVLQAFQGHRKDRQVCVAISPDGDFVASGDWSGRLRIWDRSADLRIVEAKAHADGIYHVSFSKDGSKILTTGWDETAKVWDVKAKKPIAVLKGHTGAVNGGAFFPDGKQVVTSGFDTTIRIWDVEKETEIRRLPTQRTISRCVGVSPDGKTVAAGFRDSSVRLFDPEKGVEIHRLKGHADRVIDIAFTSDGRHVLTGSYDRTLRVWNLKTGKEVARATDKKHIFNALVITPDGQRVFTGGGIWKPNEEVEEWTPELDYAIRLWQLPKDVWPHAGTARHDENRIVEVRRFGQRHTRPIADVAYFPSDASQLVVAAGYDGTVRLWNVDTGKEARTVLDLGDRSPRSVAATADGGTIAVGDHQGNISILDVENGQVRRYVKLGTGFVYDLAFSPDGSRLYVGMAHYPKKGDGAVFVYDAASGKQLRRFEGADNYGQIVAPLPDAVRVLAGSQVFNGGVWNGKTGKLITRFRDFPNTPLSLAASPDGTLAAIGFDIKKLRGGRWADPEAPGIWLCDVKTGRVIRKLRGHTGNVNALAFTPDGRYLISGSGGHHKRKVFLSAWDNTLRVWNVATGEEVARQVVDTEWGVWSLAMMPDARHVVTAGGDKGRPDLRLWRLPKRVWPGRVHRKKQPVDEIIRVGRFTGHKEGASHAIVSPDGKFGISAGRDRLIRIWDLTTQKENRVLRGHEGMVFGLAISADGKLLASSDKTGSIRLWNFKAGQPIAELPGHDKAATDLAFMPDGKHLLSAGFDETLRLWNIKDRKLVKMIKLGAKVEKMAPLWDGRRVMLSGAHTGGWGVLAYDLEKGGPIDTQASALSCLAVSPDRRKTLIGTITGLLRVRNEKAGKLIVQMADPRAKAARDAALSPNTRYAITTTREGDMHLWDLEEGKRLATMKDDSIGTISLSPDGGHALTVGRNGAVGVWKLPAGAAGKTRE